VVKVIPRRKAEVYTVTNAPRPMSEDIRYRQRRYLISMSIRTVCFVVGALFLPYISVIFANGGREPQPSARFTEENPSRKPISGQRPEIGS
jgi:hypothetical protein